MKKIFLSSIVLLTFSLAIMVFEMSCQKSVDAQTTSTSGLPQLNKLLFTKGWDIWTVNYDGTNATKVNITLPSGVSFAEGMPVMSPDGKKIFFTAGTTPAGEEHADKGDLYFCNADGSNVTKILDKEGSAISLSGAY